MWQRGRCGSNIMSSLETSSDSQMMIRNRLGTDACLSTTMTRLLWQDKVETQSGPTRSATKQFRLESTSMLTWTSLRTFRTNRDWLVCTTSSGRVTAQNCLMKRSSVSWRRANLKAWQFLRSSTSTLLLPLTKKRTSRCKSRCDSYTVSSDVMRASILHLASRGSYSC